MKRFALSLFTSSILASSAFAWVGGPFDNNTFYGRDINGTFQGVISGKNVSGIMVFGTTSGSTAGSGSASDVGVYGNGGRALIFANGSMLMGYVNSVADIPGRKLSLAIDGSRGHGTTAVAQDVKVTNARATVETTKETETKTETTTTTDTTTETVDTVTPIITTTRYFLEGATQVRGILDARFTSTFPNLIFNGGGDLEILSFTGLEQERDDDGNPYGAPWIVSYGGPVKVRVSGIRTSTNNPTIVGELDWAFPTVTSEVTTETGEPIITRN
jgi:hypothetical protein